MLALLVAAAVAAAALAAAGVVSRSPKEPTTVRVVPGDDWATAIRTAGPGGRVLVSAGTYSRQELVGIDAGSVTVSGESRDAVVVSGLAVRDSSGITIERMTVRSSAGRDISAVQVAQGSSAIRLSKLTVLPTARSGIDLFGGVRDVQILDSRIDGWGTTGEAASGGTSRGIYLNGAPYDRDSWIQDVEIRGNNITGAGGDLVLIAGAERVRVAYNRLHDPQQTGDHNDGVQSYGSDGLEIVGNTFWAPGPNGPDQAIILAPNPEVESLRVTSTLVQDNKIKGWRGTGILLAGTEGTRVIGNVVSPGGTLEAPASSLALHSSGSTPNTGLQLEGNSFDRIYAPES